MTDVLMKAGVGVVLVMLLALLLTPLGLIVWDSLQHGAQL